MNAIEAKADFAVKIGAQWLAGETQGQIYRGQKSIGIHNDMYQTLTGQADHLYDPNFDSNTNRTDFKRSAVRERP